MIQSFQLYTMQICLPTLGQSKTVSDNSQLRMWEGLKRPCLFTSADVFGKLEGHYYQFCNHVSTIEYIGAFQMHGHVSSLDWNHCVSQQKQKINTDKRKTHYCEKGVIWGKGLTELQSQRKTRVSECIIHIFVYVK